MPFLHGNPTYSALYLKGFSMKKQFLSQRVQMAIVGVGLWFLLALWSLSAFWTHISSLGEQYQFAAKCGSMAGEFALLALILWHCFNPHIGVRRWALILGFLLAVVVLVHSGAVRGATEAKTARLDTESRLAQSLTAMSKDQAATIGETGARSLSAAGSQKERAAIVGKTAAEQARVAQAAQQTLAAEIVKTDQAVKDTSILPAWYLDGWCYSAIFLFSLLCVGIIFLMMMNDEDIDRNFNGIPDGQEGRLEDSPVVPQTTVTVNPVPVAAGPRSVSWQALTKTENERGN